MGSRPFVLSGGGARGAAHLGVLRALNEADIRPNAISGTSAGALVGAFIADGRTPQEVMALVLDNVRRSRLIRRPALASTRIETFLRSHLRHERFEDLPIPLYIAATDLEKGGQHIFDSGELVPALMASCAIPVIFPPVLVNGIYYVDGGVSNNLPVEPFSAAKDQVIAVHVNPLPPFFPGRRGMLRTMDRVWHLNFRELVTRSAQGCHLFIEPPELARFNMFELSKLKAIEAIGHAWTRQLIDEGRVDRS